MHSPTATIPADFIPVELVIPGSEAKHFLGYEGTARFVGFFWNARINQAVWFDGITSHPGKSQNFTFLRFVRPLAFLYNVNFGTRNGDATHMLIRDRQTGQAYIAPKASGETFLNHQHAPFARANDEFSVVHGA